MSIGFAHNPDPADKDPKRRPQTVTVSDANGTRTMTLEEYRASDRGQARAQRELAAFNRGGVTGHPDIVFGSPEGRAQTAEEEAYRRNYNVANRGRPEVTGLDALGNVLGMVALGAGGAALMPASGGAAAGAGAATGAGGLGGTGAYGTAGSLFGTGANMSTVGLGSQGMLAASGGIAGGAGTGILGSLGGGSGLLSANSIQNAARLSGLLGGGGSSGGGGVTSMPLLGRGGGQPQAPQAAQIQQQKLPTTPQGPIQGFGRKPYQFNGATVWV